MSDSAPDRYSFAEFGPYRNDRRRDIRRLDDIAGITERLDQSVLDSAFIFPNSVQVVERHIMMRGRFLPHVSETMTFIDKVTSLIGETRYDLANNYTVGDMIVWSFFGDRTSTAYIVPFLLEGGTAPKSLIALNLNETKAFDNMLLTLDPEAFHQVVVNGLPLEWGQTASRERMRINKAIAMAREVSAIERLPKLRSLMPRSVPDPVLNI